MSVTLQFFVAAFVAGFAINTLVRSREFYLDTLRDTYERFTWRMLAECALACTATLLTRLVLLALFPAMRFSWTRWAFGNSGNLSVTGLAQAAESAHASPGWVLGTGLAGVALFLITMPAIVAIEEWQFRWKRVRPAQVARATIAFGLVHLVVGVSLGAACALMGTGLFYAHKYRQAFLQARSQSGGLYIVNEDDWHWYALKTSTAYHLVYNAFVGALVAVALVVDYLSALP